MGAISRWRTALSHWRLRVFHSQKNKSSREVGFYVENSTLNFLRDKGLILLERNFAWRFGEIDLIMEDGDIVVFIEVRYRASTHFIDPLETVTHEKQQRIIKTAEQYLLNKQWYDCKACRFDVVAVTNDRGKLAYEWVQNAFKS